VNRKPPLLGELLVRKKLLDPKHLELALAEQRATKEFLGAILVRRGWVREGDLASALAEQSGLPFVSLRDQYVDWETAMRFSSSLVVERKCLPFREDELGVVTVAITNPLDAEAMSRIEAEARDRKVKLVVVTPREMEAALREFKERVAAKIRKLLE
jgi:hypothetical protein